MCALAVAGLALALVALVVYGELKERKRRNKYLKSIGTK